MPEKALFSVLLRKSWRVSATIAVGLALVAAALLPAGYKLVGALSCAPFLVIAALAAWGQRKVPGEARVQRTAEVLASLPWPRFEALLVQAFEREGHALARRQGTADFDLTRQGRRLLVSARRWKSARHGVEPLRELQAERERLGADTAAYICLGPLSDAAQAYAKAEGIAIWQAQALTQRLGDLVPTTTKPGH